MCLGNILNSQCFRGVAAKALPGVRFLKIRDLTEFAFHERGAGADV